MFFFYCEESGFDTCRKERWGSVLGIYVDCCLDFFLYVFRVFSVFVLGLY